MEWFGQASRIAVAVGWLLSVDAGPPGQSASSWDGEAIRLTVDQVAAIVRREYMDPEVAARAGDYLRDRSVAGNYAAASTPGALADLLTRDLFAATKDKHLAVSLVRPAVPTPMPVVPAEGREQSVRRSNGGVQRVEILPGNIGYLNLTAFWRLEEARDAISGAMRLLRGADALILDMRRNSGGSPETVAWLLSYLFERPGLELFQVVPRTGTPVRYITQDVPEADRNERRPVYVLTAARTFSAGEGAPYLLQERRRAEIIGAQTAGAANPGRPYPVNDRFEVTVPNGRVRSAVNGGNWEGTGVVPDVAVAESDALRTAQVRALHRLSAGATGDWRRVLEDALKTLDATAR